MEIGYALSSEEHGPAAPVENACFALVEGLGIVTPGARAEEPSQAVAVPR